MSQISATSNNLAPDVTSNTAPPAQTTSTSGSISNGVSKDTFLKLLIAQIKNQDPLKPTDGAQFLAQLAQFSQLEQLMDIRQQITTLVAQANTQTQTETEQPQTPATGTPANSE